jgi:hypothetical protein
MKQQHQFNYLLDWTESICVLDTTVRLYQFNIFDNNSPIGHIRLSHSDNEVSASLRIYNAIEQSLQREFVIDLICRIVQHESKATFLFDINDKATVDLLENNGVDSSIIIRG